MTKIVFGLTTWLFCVASSPAQPTDERFSHLRKKFDVEFLTTGIPASTWGDSVRWKMLDDSDLQSLRRFVGFFDQEFNKYPVEFVKQTKLRNVCFVKYLTVFSQKRSAMPDYFTEVLYLDIYVGDHDSTYQKHIIHHEFYHMIEQQFNGDAYYKDPAWADLNPIGFRYGTGGRNARGSNMYPLTHPEEGFVNLYSESGLEEDKAEVYTTMFLPEEDFKVNAWAQNDSVLKSKLDYLKRFLRNKSNGQFHDSFWTSISR